MGSWFCVFVGRGIHSPSHWIVHCKALAGSWYIRVGSFLLYSFQMHMQYNKSFLVWK